MTHEPGAEPVHFSTPGVLRGMSEGALDELRALAMLDKNGDLAKPHITHRRVDVDREPVPRMAVSAPKVLNEAPLYHSFFSRGLAFDLGTTEVLLISGTASVDETGATVHPNDFIAQCWRTFRNISELLWARGMTWHNVVLTHCYLRDIGRDYTAFNNVRSQWYAYIGLHPFPASVGVGATLCRPDLLVEIEAIALSVPKEAVPPVIADPLANRVRRGG
jgi:2-iminobutanoate/2-iminopropanoate deaminase